MTASRAQQPGLVQVPIFGDRASSGGGPTPPASTDRFEASVIVGNVLNGDPAAAQAAPFQYVGDAGNGVQLEAVLNAAALSGDPTRIRLRPGTYALDPALVTLPLTVPPNVLLEGSGERQTILTVTTRDDRAVLLVSGGEVRDLGVSLLSVGEDPVGDAVITWGAAARGERVEVLVGDDSAEQDDDSLQALHLVFGVGVRLYDVAGTYVDPTVDPGVDPNVAIYQVGPRTSGPAVSDVVIRGTCGGLAEGLWLAASTSEVVAQLVGESAGATIAGARHQIDLGFRASSADASIAQRAYFYVVGASASRLALRVYDPAIHLDGYVRSSPATLGTSFVVHCEDSQTDVGIREEGSSNTWTGVCGGGSVDVLGSENTFVNLSTKGLFDDPQPLTVTGDNNVFVACRFFSVTDNGAGNEIAHGLP